MLTLSCRFPEAFAMKCVKEQDEEQRKGNPAKGASLAGFFVSLFPILYLSLKSYFVMEPHAFMLHLPSIIQWILLDFS